MVAVVVDGVVTGSYRYTTLEDVTEGSGAVRVSLAFTVGRRCGPYVLEITQLRARCPSMRTSEACRLNGWSRQCPPITWSLLGHSGVTAET